MSKTSQQMTAVDSHTGGKYTQFVKTGYRLMGHDAGAPRGPLAVTTAAECRLLREILKKGDEGKWL